MTTPVEQIQRWAPTATTCICVTLAAALWLPSGSDGVLPEIRNAQPLSSDAADIDARLTEGAEALLARPLFHTTRRPPAEMAPATPAAPAALTLSLMGILNSDDVQIALMRLSNSPELLRRRVGDQIGPWRVVEITQSAVTVVADDGSQQVLYLTGAQP